MLSIDHVRDDLRRHLPRLLLEHGIPGAAVAVSVGEASTEAAAGVVNRRTSVAVTPDSVFQIQSITKVWTATLIMQLVDDGLIGLDEPVQSHLPGFRTADPEASERITVRHLLTHTGGFEGDLWKTTTDGDDAMQRLVEDWVPHLPQQEKPGSRYSYCSAGMAVLGRIVEVKRGLPYAAALRRHLAGPLGIEHLAHDANQALGFNTAIGHARYPDLGLRPLPVWATMPASNPAAGAQLAMSAPALLAFGRMHLAHGRWNGTQLLSADAAKSMRQSQTAIPEYPDLRKDVGLGWELHADGAVTGHGGGAIGIGSNLLLVPEQRTAIAVLTNGGDHRALMRDLIDPWLNATANIELARDRRAPARSPITDAERYTGTYGNHNMRIAVSVNDDGQLEALSALTGDQAAMVERTGLVIEPWTSELRRVTGDLFTTVSANDTAGGPVEFLDTDHRARLMHTGGRSLPRTDS